MKLSDPASIPALLRRHAFHHSNEEQLQAGIARVLEENGIAFEREVDLGVAGRIDFLVGRGYGVEVKTESYAGTVERQLLRYARCSAIESLLLVSTRLRLVARMPALLDGKPLDCVWLRPSP